MDTLAAAVWYLITVVSVCAAWKTAHRIFPDDHPSQSCMHAFVIIWTFIVLVAQALGALGILSAPSFGVGVLVLILGIYYWSRTRVSVSIYPKDSTVSIFSATQINVSLWVFVWSIFAVLTAILLVKHGLMRFPSNWDSLMYHRPLIDLWIQTGSLYVPECAVWFVPGNSELMGLWWAAPFSGDYWVGLTNVPVIVLLVLGGLELCRLMKLTPIMRHATVISIVGGSVVFQQVTDSKNDIATAALFVVGLAYGIRYAGSHNKWNLMLSGCSLGLLAGIKYYAIGYALVGWMGVSVMNWHRHGRRAGLWATIALAAVMLLPAGYWYGRNYAVSGTPLYPMGYSGPEKSEAQMRRSAWKSSILGNGQLQVWPQYVNAVWRRGGLSAIVALLALPASLTWLVASAISPALCPKVVDHISHASLHALLAFVLIGAWIIFCMTPFTVDNDDNLLLATPYQLVRFSQVPLALSAIAFGLFMSDLLNNEDRGSFVYKLSVLLSVSFLISTFMTFVTNLFNTHVIEWQVILTLALCLFLCCIFLSPVARKIHGRMVKIKSIVLLMSLVACMVVFTISTSQLSNWWHDGFATHYDRMFKTRSFSILEKKEHEDTSIAVFYFRYYPFFGSQRQFRVYRPRRIESEQILYNYLETNDIDMVCIMQSSASTFEDESYCSARITINQHDDVFELVAPGTAFNLYNINKSGLIKRGNGTDSIHSYQSK